MGTPATTPPPAPAPVDHSDEIAALRTNQEETVRLLTEARAELAELKANASYVSQAALDEAVAGLTTEITTLRAQNEALSADLRKAGETPTLEPPAPPAPGQAPPSGAPDATAGAAPVPGQEPAPRRSFRPRLPTV